MRFMNATTDFQPECGFESRRCRVAMSIRSSFASLEMRTSADASS